MLSHELRSGRSRPEHISRRFILALAQIADMARQAVRRHLDVADLDDHLRSHPMDPRGTSGEPTVHREAAALIAAPRSLRSGDACVKGVTALTGRGWIANDTGVDDVDRAVQRKRIGCRLYRKSALAQMQPTNYDRSKSGTPQLLERYVKP